MSLEFEFNFSGLDSIARDVSAFTRRAGEALGERAKELLIEEEPNRTGVLRETNERILVNVPNGYGEDVEPRAFYAPYVNFGTGEFGPNKERIVPTAAKALRFLIQGHVVFAKSVAGQKPNPFRDRADLRLNRERDGIIDKAFKEVFG